MRSLFAYAAWLSHNLPASIAKILDHCAAAMFSGMLRPHFCDVAVASHRAQVMFASAHAHANRHEQCAMASDQRTNRRWKSSAPHKTSMVVAMHSNLGRLVLVDLLLGARQCGFLWVSFVCGQHLVVSSTAFMDSCTIERAHCNDHTSAGRYCCRGCFVSFYCDVACFCKTVHAKLWCCLVLYERVWASCRCSCVSHGFL